MVKLQTLDGTGKGVAGGMRILFVLLEVSETNSPYSELAMGFKDRNEVGLCTFFQPWMSIHPEIELFSGDGTFRGFFRALDAALAATDWDIVHIHTPHVGFLFLLKATLRRDLRSAMVVTIHNGFQNHKFRNKLLLVPNMAFAARVVCCGRTAAESFPLPFRWLAGRRYTYVSNGVNGGRIERARREFAPRRDRARFELVSASRFVPIKNLPTALEAFHLASIDGGHLSFIGDGPLMDRLQTFVREHDLEDGVSFTGLITRDAVFHQLLEADLFLSASFGEGLPVAALEAMACGCPVVLSDIEPHREITDGLHFVRLIEPNDVEGFAEEIRRYRMMTSAERDEIGEACRRHVEERFSLQSMLRGYASVYEDVIAGREGRITGVEPVDAS